MAGGWAHGLWCQYGVHVIPLLFSPYMLSRYLIVPLFDCPLFDSSRYFNVPYMLSFVIM